MAALVVAAASQPQVGASTAQPDVMRPPQPVRTYQFAVLTPSKAAVCVLALQQ